MKIKDDVKLDFNDVLILPKRSEYSSRSQVFLDLNIHLTHGQVFLLWLVIWIQLERLKWH